MFDLIVIGGGAGGVASALRVSQLGGKVAVVEGRELGGVCINRGCVPTKFFAGAADLFHQTKHAERYGIESQEAHFDLAKLVEKKQTLVNEMRRGTEELLKTRGVEIVRGAGRLESQQHVHVNGRELTGRNFLVATGSLPSKPDIKGAEVQGVISSEDALDLQDLPKRMLILGGETVGLELASIFSRFGVAVTVVEKNPRILVNEDHETAQRLTLAMRRSGVAIEVGAEVASIRSENGTLFVTLVTGKGEKRIAVDRVVFSQRTPQIEGLNLPSLGIRTEGTWIKVNRQLRTVVPSVYAIGDVAGGGYSHVASAQGMVVADCVMGREGVWEDRFVPRGIYTRPEAASVGMTQSEAEQKGIEIVVGKIPYATNARAMTLGDTAGAVKIIAGARYREVLGVHIVGPHATELISEAALAVKVETVLEDFIQSIRLHPTLSESLGEAARDALGEALYVPKR